MRSVAKRSLITAIMALASTGASNSYGQSVNEIIGKSKRRKNRGAFSRGYWKQTRGARHASQKSRSNRRK